MDNVQKRISETARLVEKATLEISPEENNETPDEKKKRMSDLEADPEAWFAYYFRKYASSKPAQFHKEASKRVLSNPEWYEVRMWSRELAKTTRTMMEVLYLTLVGYKSNASPPHTTLPLSMYGPGVRSTPPSPSERAGESSLKRYVLMISNSFDNACRLLLPYKFSLEKNQYLIRDYGIQKKFGHWKSGEFITKQGIAFRALGAGQSPRGTRNEEVRPDVILFDDIDTDADCLNPQLISKKWRWIEEAAISTRSVSVPLLVIFCGNRIAIDCCVERATKYANHTDTVNIRDEDNNSS